MKTAFFQIYTQKFKPKVWLTGWNLFIFSNFTNRASICSKTLNFSVWNFFPKNFLVNGILRFLVKCFNQHGQNPKKWGSTKKWTKNSRTILPPQANWNMRVVIKISKIKLKKLKKVFFWKKSKQCYLGHKKTRLSGL